MQRLKSEKGQGDAWQSSMRRVNFWWNELHRHSVALYMLAHPTASSSHSPNSGKNYYCANKGRVSDKPHQTPIPEPHKCVATHSRLSVLCHRPLYAPHFPQSLRKPSCYLLTARPALEISSYTAHRLGEMTDTFAQAVDLTGPIVAAYLAGGPAMIHLRARTQNRIP